MTRPRSNGAGSGNTGGWLSGMDEGGGATLAPSRAALRRGIGGDPALAATRHPGAGFDGRLHDSLQRRQAGHRGRDGQSVAGSSDASGNKERAAQRSRRRRTGQFDAADAWADDDAGGGSWHPRGRHGSGRGGWRRGDDRADGWRAPAESTSGSGGMARRGGASTRGASSASQEDTAVVSARSAGHQEYFVTCHPGMEQALAAELRSLGIAAVSPGVTGASFWSPRTADGYRACLWLRSAVRVLQLLHRCPLDTDVRVGYGSGDSLYAATRLAADWGDVVPAGLSFGVDARVWNCTDLTSSKLACTRIKDAVCDSIRDAGRAKPDPPERGTVPDVPLYASLYNDTFALYRDLSGSSLHRRGYRSAMHKAPLNEAAAAGMLLMAGWQRACAPDGDGDDAVLVDPMCGSATLLLEGALIARNVAPGLLRAADSWPFRRWPDANRGAMRDAVEEARSLQRAWKGQLLGSDVHAGALSLARRDAHALGASDVMTLRQGDCADWALPSTPSMVVVNPPWGQRLSGRGAASTTWQQPRTRGGGHLPVELQSSWLSLNAFLRGQCGGVTAHVLSGSQEPVNLLRMRPSKRSKVTVGGIECRLYQLKVLPPKAPGAGDAPSAAAPQSPVKAAAGVPAMADGESTATASAAAVGAPGAMQADAMATARRGIARATPQPAAFDGNDDDDDYFSS